MTEAIKEDSGKPRLDLLPTESLIEIAYVLTHGANKYGEHNWRQGMNWSRMYGAALRHLFAWYSGEDKDSETNRSHLAHACCCLLFLLSYTHHQSGHDDRAQ